MAILSFKQMFYVSRVIYIKVGLFLFACTLFLVYMVNRVYFNTNNKEEINNNESKNKKKETQDNTNIEGKPEDTEDGLKIETKDVTFIYSEKGKIHAKIYADIAIQSSNKDVLYPKGVFVEFYDDNEVIKGTLKAGHVRYISKDNIYKIGNWAKIVNLKNNNTLESPNLMWDVDTKRVKTNNSVTITTQDVKLVGKGLDAEEDLSEYTIFDIRGKIKIKNKKKEKQIEQNKIFGNPIIT